MPVEGQPPSLIHKAAVNIGRHKDPHRTVEQTSGYSWFAVMKRLLVRCGEYSSWPPEHNESSRLSRMLSLEFHEGSNIIVVQAHLVGLDAIYVFIEGLPVYMALGKNSEEFYYCSTHQQVQKHEYGDIREWEEIISKFEAKYGWLANSVTPTVPAALHSFSRKK